MRVGDLKDERFGRLVAKRRVKNSQCGKVRWYCHCDCGRRKTVSASNLRRGETKSCGCLPREGIIQRSIRHGLSKSVAYALWAAAKHRAKLNDILFNVEPQDIVVPEFCPALAIRLECTGKRAVGPQRQSPTLDRIESGLGYVKGNIWVISCRANSVKNDATFEEMEGLVAALKKYKRCSS
jgi:hypothetical protein